MRSLFNSIKSKINVHSAEMRDVGYTSTVATMAILVGLFFMPIDAMAQAFDVPFISGMGCSVANWMKGPLAIMIFVIVCIATLVVGLITKMDWGRMITVAVVFGIIQGFVSLLLSSGRVQLPGCLAA